MTTTYYDQLPVDMDIISERIKDMLTMEDVLRMYGFETSIRGRIPCPLHNGHDRNFSYKEKYFKCFVCGASGTVIDFVMKLFDIPFRQAILRINADFALGLTWDKPDPAVRSAILEARRREARRKAKLERLEEKYWEPAAEHQYWWDALKYFAPTREDWEAGYIHPLYAEAVKKQPYLEYLLDELEEEILEVEADRGRKGTAAGKHSPGGPGQTA